MNLCATVWLTISLSHQFLFQLNHRVDMWLEWPFYPNTSCSFNLVGFHVESQWEENDHDFGGDSNNGVLLVISANHTSELIWHASITALTSQGRSCPYSAGTAGILQTSTHTVPVVLIWITTWTRLPWPVLSLQQILLNPLKYNSKHRTQISHLAVMAGITVPW